MDWAADAHVNCCRILENRPEIGTRRDADTEINKAFKGKRVAVWGCGALGAPIAIHLAGAGAKRRVPVPLVGGGHLLGLSSWSVALPCD